MSLSKLESLPNEILSDIIEKYINGVDVLIAFGYQLNRRFSVLIAQSRRLHFNFIQCQKDHFRFCMGLLPAYIDQIEELSLSEQDTPGQIHAFLSFFPSFSPFKRLRKLYFHWNAEAVARNMVEGALRSLSGTTIDTLSIKIMNARERFPLDDRIFDHIPRLTTLTRFRFVGESIYIDWDHLRNIFPNMEYLSVSGRNCEYRHLESILQNAPRLKYLDIGIINGASSSDNKLKRNLEKNIVPMSVLRTLVLSFEGEGSTTLDMLAPYLKVMPVLNHLEIEGSSKLVDADMWQMLLERSLPLLTHFTLRTTISRSSNVDIHNLLAPFQTSFWLLKKNFNLIITTKASPFDALNGSVRQNLGGDDFNLPVTQCWTVPDRTVNGDVNTVNKITSCSLSVSNDTVPSYHYFDNVKYLIVDNMDGSLFKWMTTYVNCSRITELTITPSCKKIDELPSLLARVSNMNSLHISFDLLINKKDAFVKKNNRLKCLDLSVSRHVFNERGIIIITTLFPDIEHIHINTSDLHNIPMLKTYLPRLRSLTFDGSIDRFSYYDNYATERWVHNLRQETNFLFEYTRNSITVWIDQAVYEESYWQTFAAKSLVSTATSVTTAVSVKKKKKHKFSFFNFFK